MLRQQVSLANYRVPLTIVAAFKIGYFAILLLCINGYGEIDSIRGDEIAKRWFPQGGGAYTPLSTWDSVHYLFLAQHGYRDGSPSCAFYPLWPLAIRCVSILTGGNHIIAGLIAANLFSLIALLLFYDFARQLKGERVALWALLLLLSFPGSLFLNFIYSEALFLLLIMGLWRSLEQGHPYRSAFFGYLLPLCRGVGIFAVLPIFWFIGRAWLLNRSSSGSRPRVVQFKDAHPRALAALLCAPFAGWGTYLVWMGIETGNPFEGFEAQKFWRVHSISNLWNLPKFVNSLLEPTSIHDFVGSALDRSLFILLLWCLPLIFRLGSSYLIWTYMLGIIPAMSGSFSSFVRFESMVFPLFLALAVFFQRHDRLGMLFIAVSFVLHAILVWNFVNYAWAG